MVLRNNLRNAGRKQKYGERTKNITVRCPKSKIHELKEIITNYLKLLEVKNAENKDENNL
jgi:hypothetical protein